MRASLILGRIAVRSGVALWRHRLALLLAAFIVGAFTVYQFSFVGPSIASGDCADTAMAAITHTDNATAHAAFACLGPGMRTTSEDQFVTSVTQQAVPGQVSRVADARTNDGGRIVFYTVQAQQGPQVGYIVYLDAGGKVIKVE
jgi:hypothetical protein